MYHFFSTFLALPLSSEHWFLHSCLPSLPSLLTHPPVQGMALLSRQVIHLWPMISMRVIMWSTWANEMGRVVFWALLGSGFLAFTRKWHWLSGCCVLRLQLSHYQRKDNEKPRPVGWSHPVLWANPFPYCEASLSCIFSYLQLKASKPIQGPVECPDGDFQQARGLSF